MAASLVIKPSPRPIFKTMILVVCFLGLASLIGQSFKHLTGHDFVFGLIPKFNLDHEHNIPTYFSSLILLSSALLLALIALVKKREKDPFFIHWTILSIGFFWMSLDEAAGLHELLIKPLRQYFHLSGILYFSWLIVLIPIVVILGIYFLKFLQHLSKETRNRFLLAGFLYLAGAVGIEMVGGYYSNHFGEDNMNYVLIVHLEEMLEMIGITFFIQSILNYMDQIDFSLVIHFTQNSKVESKRSHVELQDVKPSWPVTQEGS